MRSISVSSASSNESRRPTDTRTLAAITIAASHSSVCTATASQRSAEVSYRSEPTPGSDHVVRRRLPERSAGLDRRPVDRERPRVVERNAEVHHAGRHIVGRGVELIDADEERYSESDRSVRTSTSAPGRVARRGDGHDRAAPASEPTPGSRTLRASEAPAGARRGRAGPRALRPDPSAAAAGRSPSSSRRRTPGRRRTGSASGASSRPARSVDVDAISSSAVVTSADAALDGGIQRSRTSSGSSSMIAHETPSRYSVAGTGNTRASPIKQHVVVAVGCRRPEATHRAGAPAACSGTWNEPSASAATPGASPITTATDARMPSG